MTMTTDPSAPHMRASRMFLDMLGHIGPQTSADLIARLQLDFENTAQALGGCASTPFDWATLRAQSHVLIGLAATVGYDDLTDIAHAINASAHAQHPDTSHAADLIHGAKVGIAAAIPALGLLILHS